MLASATGVRVGRMAGPRLLRIGLRRGSFPLVRGAKNGSLLAPFQGATVTFHGATVRFHGATVRFHGRETGRRSATPRSTCSKKPKKVSGLAGSLLQRLRTMPWGMEQGRIAGPAVGLFKEPKKVSAFAGSLLQRLTDDAFGASDKGAQPPPRSVCLRNQKNVAFSRIAVTTLADGARGNRDKEHGRKESRTFGDVLRVVPERKPCRGGHKTQISRASPFGGGLRETDLGI